MSNRKEKRGYGSLSKIILVSSLTLAAILTGGGIVTYANSLADTDINSIADIQGVYGRSVGITKITQEQLTNNSGIISTTINVASEGKKEDIIPILNYIAKDINENNKGEIVNINFSIVTPENEKYVVKFFPNSSQAYNSDDFKEFKSLASVMTNKFTHYELELKPISSGNNLTVKAGISNYLVSTLDTTETLEDLNQNLYTTINNYLPFKNGSSYDIAFENAGSSQNVEPLMSYRQILTENSSFLKVLKEVPENFREVVYVMTSEKEIYGNLTPTSSQYTQINSQPGQLVILTDKTGEQLDTAVLSLKNPRQYSYGKIFPSKPYEIVIRNEINGANLFTFNSYYTN